MFAYLLWTSMCSRRRTRLEAGPEVVPKHNSAKYIARVTCVMVVTLRV